MCLFLVQWPEKELGLHVYFTYQAPNGEKNSYAFFFFFGPAAYRERGEEKKPNNTKFRRMQAVSYAVK